MNFTDECEAEVYFKPYSSQIGTIRLDICDKTSELKSEIY